MKKFGLIILIAIFNFAFAKCDGQCLTQECVRESKNILESIDTSVDACDDFYKHACGNFIKNTKIPDGRASISAFSKLNIALKAQLYEVFKSPISHDDIEPFKISKTLFKACMNKKLIEEQELKPIKNHFNEMGGWPVVEGDNWHPNSWSWQSIQFELEKRGFSSKFIFKSSIVIDSKNSSRWILQVDQMEFEIERELLVNGLDDDIVRAYYDYMVDAAVIFGANRSRAEIEMRDVVNFEIRLAEISIPEEQRRNLTALYNLMSIKDFQEKFPVLDWHEYLLQIYQNNITEDETIHVTDYVKIVGKLKELFDTTPNRIIVNYLFWRTTLSKVEFFNDEIRNRNLAFNKIFYGQTSFEERSKECAGVVTEYLPIATSALYVKNFFQQSSKEAALTLVTTIHEEFMNTLRTLEWMDKDTRKEALKKAKLMRKHVAYPNELRNDLKLLDYHDGLTIDGENYFESLLNISKFMHNKKANDFRLPVNKSDWRKHGNIAQVNAYHDPNENLIQIFAGILQGTFFSADRPNYLNFGAIGTLIGHEIFHGFDDAGSQYDANGNIADWWKEDTKQAYLEKTRCIVEQYGNFTESNSGLNVNGIKTQGENIADNSGLMLAYNSYLKYIETNGEELPLPGLNYTSKQLFWISYATSWCSVDTPEATKLVILNDEHAPNEFRVNGATMNMEKFSEDFNCPQGSKMNITNRCRVW